MNNELIEILDKNVLMEFEFEEQDYVVLIDEDEYDKEEQDAYRVYFAKKDYLEDGTAIVRNIEDNEQYERVLKEYEKLIQIMMEDEENGII